MNKKLQLFLGLFTFAVVIAGAVIIYNSLSEAAPPVDNLIEEPQDDRERAPDFTMHDMYGNEVQLSDFFGRPIVLNFWTTWCPSCVAEMPYFEELYQEMGDEIQILKVNLLDGRRETRETVDAFLASRENVPPIFFDETGEASRAYNIRLIPITHFIDAAGVIVATVQGPVNENSMQNGVDLAMGLANDDS
jgi:thiol-disulfide isomerase/thioredoxin